MLWMRRWALSLPAVCDQRPERTIRIGPPGAFHTEPHNERAALHDHFGVQDRSPHLAASRIRPWRYVP